jgi:hypothetical protein
MNLDLNVASFVLLRTLCELPENILKESLAVSIAQGIGSSAVSVRRKWAQTVRTLAWQLLQR